MASEGSENSMDSSEVEDSIQDSENSETDFDNSSDQSMEQDDLSSREKEEEESANQMKLDTLFGRVYSDKKKGPLEIYRLLPGSLYEKYEFVKKIMNACDFGPTFDTFCFSLPKPDDKEISFKGSVQNMKELHKKCQEGSVEFPSKDLSEFPSEFSKQQANKLCEKIRKKLKMESLKEKDEPPVVLYTKLVPGGEIIKVTKKRKLGTNEKDTTTELKPGFYNDRKKEKSPKKRKHNDDQDGDFETNDHDNNDSDMDDFDDEEAFSDQNEEQIVNTILDDSFPHGILHLLSDGKTDILPSWCGQIQLRVNPIDKSLSFLMYDYEPSYPDEIRDKIFKGISSPKVCEAIAKEVEKFECCRQLRMDIPLENLEELFVVKQNTNEILMFSKLVPPAKFYQRFINVNTKDRNNWTERQPFLPFEGQSFSDCSRTYLLAFGGDFSEISDILAQIKACRLDQKICINPKKNTMSELLQDVSDNQTGIDYSFSNAKKKTEDRNIEVDFTRRNKILNILKKHNIITKKKFNEMKKTMKVIQVKIPSGKVYNGLDDLELAFDDVCFKDYLNHVCINVRELEQHLTKKLRAGDYALKMESLHLKYPDKYDFDDITVAEFLTAEKDDITGWKEIFYSFCRSEPQQDNCTWHCDVCKSCEPWRTWHCPKCDKCTYGKENPICEFCGYKDYSCDFELMDLRNERHKNQQFIIQPYTYYWGGLFSEGKTSTLKSDWNIKLSLTDIPDWTREMKVDGETTRHFNLKDYLNHDDLGMVNLWRLAYRLQGSGPRRHVGRFFSQRFRWEIKSKIRLL